MLDAIPATLHAALLEALEDERTGGQVDPVHGQSQRLGQAAAGIGEPHAIASWAPIPPKGGETPPGG